MIDEVQSAPALLPAIKREVDRHPVPGRFLLTGSANAFMLPNAAESRAGRMEVLTLEPLSQCEVEGPPHNCVVALFGSAPWVRRSVPTGRADLARRLVSSGFPEALGRAEPQRRDAWSLLQRDVRDYANIEGLHDMPRLLSLLAARASSLLNMGEVSRSTGIAHSTLRRYLSLLEALYIVQPLPAWSANLGKRLVKSPKVYVRDSGMLHALLGLASVRQLQGHPVAGASWEGFVVEQVAAALPTVGEITFHRTAAGAELDLVVETPAGRIGIEINFSASPKPTKGFWQALQDLAIEGAFVVAPVLRPYPLSLGVEVVPVWDIAGIVGQVAGQ